MALFSRPSAERISAVLRLRALMPDLSFQSLVVGVDNLRHDVVLSPAFVAFTRAYILKLFTKHSKAGDLLASRPAAAAGADRAEFRRMAQELLLAGLDRAKSDQNAEIDLLANAALFKYLSWEIQQQYAFIVAEGKNRLKMYEGPKHERNVRAFQLKEIFSEFQANKKNVLRRVSAEVLSTVNEVQADVVRRTREAFFGDATAWFAYFSNPLLCTDGSRDDYIQMTKYVMLGNFSRDPDLYERVEAWLRVHLQPCVQNSDEVRDLAAAKAELAKAAADVELLRTQAASPGRGFSRLFGRTDTSATPEAAAALQAAEERLQQCEDQLRASLGALDSHLGDIIATVENIQELFGSAASTQALNEARVRGAARDEVAQLQEKIEIQAFLADEFFNAASTSGLLPCLAAAYEAAAIHQDYCPPINPQQLKHGLLDAGERRKVMDLVEHYKLPSGSAAGLEQAANRVRSAGQRELRVLFFRFLEDFARYQRDIRLAGVMQRLQERVNLLFDEKTIELSRINRTLYEFLLPAERRPRDRRVLGHVILKADVRDSTSMVADLLARGLNPASHFSLNFFDPLNKLFTRYDATKVFIEGDAVIVATFEVENEQMGGLPMARICGLAREMMEVVKAYNARAEKTALPRLDIGIGICSQDSAPLYLLDGENRIMISSAINLADRLAGCSKLARRVIGSNDSPFDVYVFQTISDEMTGGVTEEFLVRFNTGICLSPEAFARLRQEISLKMLEGGLMIMAKTEKVRLYTGTFPISRDVFQRLVIREARVPFVDARDFSLKYYTDHHYYELCTDRKIYQLAEQAAARVCTPAATQKTEA